MPRLSTHRSILTPLLRQVQACRICAAALPLGPRPILQLAATARLLIIGQAPGSKAHTSGVPWNDASGERLRAWLDLDRSAFYNSAQIALVPMGFCYPGAKVTGGDLPPRPECAATWHTALLKHTPDIRITLLVGHYAQRHYLAGRRKATLTDTVRAFSDYGPQFFPLPHPSWRSLMWTRKQPWFERTVIPELRKAVRRALS